MLPDQRESLNKVFMVIFLILFSPLLLPCGAIAVVTLIIIALMLLVYFVMSLILSFWLWFIINNKSYWSTVKLFFQPIIRLFNKEYDDEPGQHKGKRSLDKKEEKKDGGKQ